MKQIAFLVVIMLAAMVPAVAAAADTGTGDAYPDSLEIDDGAKYRLLSSGFIPNVGQYYPGVEYFLQYQGTTVFFTRDGLVLVHTSGDVDNTSRDVIRQSFSGASLETNLTASGQRAGVVNYYVGNDSLKWLSGIPVYSEIVYEDLYPGIDLMYAEKNGRLKREFHLSPGADPSQIELLYEGESGPHVDGDGVLRFASPAGEMLESPLVCWQVIGGERVDRAAEYVVDDGSIRIDVAEYDAGYELVIDPELVYSSYLGGSGYESSRALASDGAGGVWVMGETGLYDFPVLNESQSIYGGGDCDVFISHFSSSGTLLSSTFLGGRASDSGHALASDGAGGVWVMGDTYSTDFPVLNAYQNSNGGGGDAFVSHFSSSGTLLSSTYLGGRDSDGGRALASDSAGGVWVMGVTTSTDFPVLNAYQSTYGGGSSYGDAFVSHFSSSGTLLSSTYLGGRKTDRGDALASDGAGGVWVMGDTYSTDFPVLNAYQSNSGGEMDAFVSHFSSSGTPLSSTYLGGRKTDRGDALAGDGARGVWAMGDTRSTNFPVLNAYQSSSGGQQDAFVAKFSSVHLPTANFTANTTAGPAPLTVRFTDESTGGPTAWSWTFGDGATSTDQHPVHTYRAPGTYTVSLNATNAGGSSTETKTDYITVIALPPIANFSVNATAGPVPLAVRFTDTSTGEITAWLWDFGNGATSTDQHPVHTYTAPGNYTVTLSIDGGLSTATKPNYIKVTPILFGDANGDGEVNQADTLKVLRQVVGLDPDKPDAEDPERFRRTDVHRNGVIEVGDALFIAQYNVGLRDVWFELPG